MVLKLRSTWLLFNFEYLVASTPTHPGPVPPYTSRDDVLRATRH